MISHQLYWDIGKKKYNYFLSIDIVYTIDREYASEEKTQTNVFRKNEWSGKYRENKLDIRGKSDKKRTRNFHKFLEKEIKYYRSNDARWCYAKHAKWRKILDRIRTRSVLISPKYKWSYQSTDHPANQEFTGAKMIFSREYEVSTVGEDGEEDVEISEEWSCLCIPLIELRKDKYDTCPYECDRESVYLLFLDFFMEKKVRTDEDKCRSEKINNLSGTNIGKLNPICIEDAIDPDSHTNNYKQSDMFPWVLGELSKQGKYHYRSYKVAKKSKYPWRNFREDKLGTNNSYRSTKSDSEKEDKFLHE